MAFLWSPGRNYSDCLYAVTAQGVATSRCVNNLPLNAANYAPARMNVALWYGWARVATSSL